MASFNSVVDEAAATFTDSPQRPEQRDLGVEELGPAVVVPRPALPLGRLHAEVDHPVDADLEVRREDRVDVHVRRGVGEVDGVGDAILDGELHRVHVVAERLVDLHAVLHDAIVERRREPLLLLVVDVTAARRAVLDDEDLLPPDADAAHVLVEVDELLERHHVEARGVVGAHQLLGVADDAHVLPAAAVGGLEDRGELHVVDDRLPRERELEVAQAAILTIAGM